METKIFFPAQQTSKQFKLIRRQKIRQFFSLLLQKALTCRSSYQNKQILLPKQTNLDLIVYHKMMNIEKNKKASMIFMFWNFSNLFLEDLKKRLDILQQMTNNQPNHKNLNLNELANQQNWNQVKKFRAQIVVTSLKKAAQRVIRQKEEEKLGSLQTEDRFNLALAKEVNFQKVATEYGDANSVTKGVFSPKGNLYLTIGSSGEGHVWNSENPVGLNFCSKITGFTAVSKLCSADFHPRVGTIPGNAPNIITGSTTGDLNIWTLLSERPQQQSIQREGHSDRINEIKFLNNGSHFLSASYDKSWILWDTKRLVKVFGQKGHEKQIHSLSLHPDGSLVITSDLGGFGMIWDLRTGQGVYQVRQSDAILCSAFSPNGFQLAVAGKNNLISIFDLRRKKQLKRIPAHLKLISDLKYEKDGLFLASASHDNTVKLWHGMSYTPIICDEFQQQHKITSIDLNNGRLAVTGIDRKWSMFINKTKWKHQLSNNQTDQVK